VKWRVAELIVFVIG